MDKSTTSNRAKLALGGLGFAVAIFFAVNIFANAALKGHRLDLTEDQLFTLSEGTSQVISSIDEPITVRLYFSKALGEVNPRLQTYFNRIRDLLDQYANISKGKLRFELYNPEPFTEDEDRAVAFGLQGVPINNAGDRGYFGLVTTNSTDDQEIYRVFEPTTGGLPGVRLDPYDPRPSQSGAENHRNSKRDTDQWNSDGAATTLGCR